MRLEKSKRLKTVVFCLGLTLTGLIFGAFSTNSVLAISQTRLQKLELFSKVLFLVETQYYRNVDTGKLIQGALQGMMETLDPHSTFLNKELFAKLNEETKGEFGGIGIEVSYKDGVLYVVTPIEDTPAYHAGIKANDKIVEIDYEPTLGMSLEDAVTKMRGPTNSVITLGISREGTAETLTFKVKRTIIKTKSTKRTLIKNNFGYIRLTQFQKNAGVHVAEELTSLKQQATPNGGLKGVVLDLRANPGGLLEEAVDVSSLFLNDGIVVSTEGRDPKNKDIRYVKKSGLKDTTIPLVVLVNGSSASASEIVAGALQDHNRALIMGTQTFGKGSVQTIAKLDDEQGVKLTVAQYMTPSGKKIQAIGVKPDIEIGEFEGEWVSSHEKKPEYVREVDLKNHLTATIESEDETNNEKKRIIEERKKIAEKIKSKKENKIKLDEGKKYDPTEDYQVIQAVNYLESFKVIRNLKDK